MWIVWVHVHFEMYLCNLISHKDKIYLWMHICLFVFVVAGFNITANSKHGTNSTLQTCFIKSWYVGI